MDSTLLHQLSDMTITEPNNTIDGDKENVENALPSPTTIPFKRTHPERPERITRILETLSEDGLLEKCCCIPSRLATKDELLLVHSLEHVEEIEKLHERSLRELYKRGEDFDSIYLSEHAWESARLAAGCTLQLLDAILTSKVQNGAAVVRPPGHHALFDQPMGFCIFNNVAMAAKTAREKYGIKRICIVDWDVHWGNGIEKMFEDDPNVLYFSIHRYDNGNFWPNDKGADYDNVGKGEGEGKTIHVAWNNIGMGDCEYLMAFTMLLLPVAYEFRPELVIVSCGFDSGLGDPKGLCKVTPEGFAQLTHLLMGLAEGKIMLVLEGGYNLSTISASMSSCVQCLLGDACPAVGTMAQVKESAVESILNTVRVQSKYWHCLKWAETYLSCKEVVDRNKVWTEK
eukprot:gene6840-7608_t